MRFRLGMHENRLSRSLNEMSYTTPEPFSVKCLGYDCRTMGAVQQRHRGSVLAAIHRLRTLPNSETAAQAAKADPLERYPSGSASRDNGGGTST